MQSKNAGDHSYGLTNDLFTSVPQRKKDKNVMVDALKSIKARLSLNKMQLEAFRSLARVERNRMGPLAGLAFELVSGVSQS